MTLVDTNVLIYAWNSRAAQHQKARAWIEETLSNSDWVGFPWVTIWGFLRISTNPRLFSRPLTGDQAFGIVNAWLERERVVSVQPGPRHGEILQKLVLESKATGPLITDAVLAALAIENGATLASTDHDFSRFKGLNWIDPLAD